MITCYKKLLLKILLQQSCLSRESSTMVDDGNDDFEPLNYDDLDDDVDGNKHEKVRVHTMFFMFQMKSVLQILHVTNQIKELELEKCALRQVRVKCCKLPKLYNQQSQYDQTDFSYYL